MMILGHRALAFAATRPSVPLWWVESLTMTVEHHRVSFAVAAERVRFGICALTSLLPRWAEGGCRLSSPKAPQVSASRAKVPTTSSRSPSRERRVRVETEAPPAGARQRCHARSSGRKSTAAHLAPRPQMQRGPEAVKPRGRCRA